LAEAQAWSHECFERVLRFLPTADLVLFVGTSFSVGITDWIVEDSRAARRACWSIDPSRDAPPGVRSIASQAEELLPTLVAT